ncbi:MAG: HAMP domain-containing histidine kinase, partial [Desulfobacterales bacterium]|nr:HAMP domain-containing histidine kinase [Desulfobacterales bacterium]
ITGESVFLPFLCNSFKIDSEAGEFEVDREIFRSILVNAMEACMDPRLERALQVCFSAARNGDGARFEIADNGTGMDTGQKNKIFSKFYSSKGNKGTGLGLFIARKVVEQHGGKIYVDSEPGAGSRFTVIMSLNVRKSG